MPPSVYEHLFPTMWLLWAAYWWALSRNVKTTTRRESWVSRWLHFGPLVLAAWLLWVPVFPLPALAERFVAWAPWQFWLGALLTAVGLVFAVWARRHIGRNWSGSVTLKQGHELITSGPYALVRHPIYTGLLLAFVGSAVARADARAVLAVLIALAALWRKLKLEERWMREQFGDAYLEYSRRVAALIPYLL
jgi:protein-S-isoprenylcysteine O-methyltransferase Ste14